MLSIPKHTLGWDILDWCSTYLAQPDGDGKGDVWVFTNEQALFVLNFYAVDEDGKWLYRRAMLSRPKGWGKSPFVGAICSAEFLGPVLFDGWDANGNAVGRPNYSSHVQVAATNVDQAENTMAMVREMLQQGEAMDAYNLDPGLVRFRAPGGRILERITTSPRGTEGNRATFAVLDETHHWVPANFGDLMAAAIRRNLRKGGYRSIETTNAPVPGEGSVAEATDSYQKQILAGDKPAELLYDSAEIFIENIYDKEQALPALRQVYGDATWVDVEDVFKELSDPSLSEQDARRFYFNQRVIRGSQWLNPQKWQDLTDGDLRLKKSDPIALGFRGQTRDGACALVATRLDDNAIFVLKSWETDPKNQEVPYVEVDEFVRSALNFYNVKLFFAAPQNWQDIVGRWYEEHEGIVEERWLNQKLMMSKATEEFETAVYAQRLVHDGDERLKQHIGNALIEEHPFGHTIRKATKHSEHYISVAETAILSFAAAQEAIQRGLNTEGPTGYVYSF